MLIPVEGHLAYAYTGGRPFLAGQPVVVFIHGASHDHSVWILQSRYLAHHGWNVLAVDLPGHGRSVGAPLPSVEAQARWILSFLDALEVTRAALVGHSMGSLIAIEVAAQAPRRATQLVLIACAYPMRVSENLLLAAEKDEARAQDMINVWSHSAQQGGFSHKPSHPGPGFNLPWGNRRLMQRQSPGVLLVDFAACNTYQNGASLATSEAGILFILGERDAMTPLRAGLAFAAQIGKQETLVIPKAGHALMSEAPDQVLEALKRFLSKKAP